MKRGWFGLIELFVALLFVAGWGVLEWVTSRRDRRRGAAAASPSYRVSEAAQRSDAASPSCRAADATSLPEAAATSKDTSRHPEG